MAEALAKEDIHIAPADDAVLPACFALLPMLASPDAVIFAARDRDGRLLGAGGLLWRLWSDPPGMPGWIEILPEARRRGVGSALLSVMADAARGEADRLWSINARPDDGDAAAFAASVGARAGSKQFHFEITDVGFLHQMTDIVRRLSASGRIPNDIEVRSLAAHDVDAVKWLIAEELLTPPPQLDAMLSGVASGDAAPTNVDRERSVVVIANDGSLAGALLSRRVPADEASEILCNVVAPKWRRGFVNALLLQRFSQLSVDAGCYRIRFDCDEAVRDTIGLARRGGADHVRTMARFAYAIAAEDAD